MQIDYRFRVHRNASCFPDNCSMDLFFLPDGSVRGTVRDITETRMGKEAGVGFVPVEIKVDPSFVAEMKELFQDAESTQSSPWISVGYGEAGSQLTIKHLCPPEKGEELSTHARFWEQCVSLCEMCLYQYRCGGVDLSSVPEPPSEL